MGYSARGRWLYGAFSLTRFHLALARGRRVFNRVRFFTTLVMGVNFWAWLVFFIIRSGNYRVLFGGPEYWLDFTSSFNSAMRLLFWLGILCFIYLFYRSVREKPGPGAVERHDYKTTGIVTDIHVENWRSVSKLPRKKVLNIQTAFTDEALSILGQAYELADKSNHLSVAPAHLFFVLMNSNRIANIFVRLGLPANTIQQRLVELLAPSEKNKTKDAGAMPLPSIDFWQVIFQSYESAYSAHQEYVSVTELLLASVEESTELQAILYDLGVDKNKLLNVVEWARIRERLYRDYRKMRVKGSHRSKTGMDKAMTALATPYLNQLSEDMTRDAQLGRLETCVAREDEIEAVFRIIQGGGQSVLLVGDHGMGKRSIVDGIAERMIAEDVPLPLFDKRLVRLSVSSLLAGTTPSGAVERLLQLLNEISRARNVVLYINNIHELMGVSAGARDGSLDVADALVEALKDGGFFTIATTTDEEYARHIANSPLSGVFTKVDIKEMSENQAIQVVESRVAYIEYKQNVFFAYNAIEKAVKLAKRFLRDTYLPGSALEIVVEAAAQAHAKKGANSLVTAEEVSAVVAEKTKIPVATITAGETEKLARLETEMHEQVIGQDEAVNLVANALRRARAEIREASRPIANFLFLGPTGVGKTELAKTIAKVYFGGEDRMIRLDMSEYQDKSAIYRLIGAPGEKGSGILTEAVKRQPFAIVLLDEVEKADADILNLFLAVMDDGRLTDSTGRVVDFTNVILVMTSNAGTAYVQDQLRAGLSSDAIKDRLLHGELKQYFRPEFLNRFDGIILFRALTDDDIHKIAGLMLQRVARDLEIKGYELVVEAGAIDYLASVGFDPEFGARPMRRAIQEKIENKLAEFLLSGQLKRRDKIILGAGGGMRVES